MCCSIFEYMQKKCIMGPSCCLLAYLFFFTIEAIWTKFGSDGSLSHWHPAVLLLTQYTSSPTGYKRPCFYCSRFTSLMLSPSYFLPSNLLLKVFCFFVFTGSNAGIKHRKLSFPGVLHIPIDLSSYLIISTADLVF